MGSRVGGRVGALGFQSWLVVGLVLLGCRAGWWPGLVLWGWLVAVRVGALGFQRWLVVGLVLWSCRVG